MPCLYEEYRKGILQNAGVYKSEGLLLFTSSEVEKDSLLRDSFSIITKKRNICWKESYNRQGG